MQLMTLNVWGGRVKQPLLQFLQEHRNTVDIFCFQEVYDNFTKDYEGIFKTENISRDLFEEISEVLSGHTGYFCPVFEKVYGIALFINKETQVINTGSLQIYDNPEFRDQNDPDSDHPRRLQWATIAHEHQPLLIVNLHGHWVPGDKQDNPARLEQSQRIINFIDSQNIPVILCGDFNLRPDTKSVGMIAEKLTNLITKYEIQSTRSTLYTKEEKFADYVFVSSDLPIEDFKVLDDEVSDHSPLLLTVS